MGYKRCPRCNERYDDKLDGCPKCKKTKENERQAYYREINKDKDGMLRTTRWKKLRQYIINRDGGICQRCWVKYGIINTDRLEVNHIKSRRDFPELMWEEDNLITVCHTCNCQLGVSNELDFIWTPPIPHEYNF